MRHLFSAVIVLTACGGKPVEAPAIEAPVTNWHASNTNERSPLTVTLDPEMSMRDAMSKLVNPACSMGSIFVWGDLQATETARPTVVKFGKTGSIEGFVICDRESETLLKMQLANPRLKTGHGGAADVNWHDGQLFMKRHWGSGVEIPLARLDPPPDNVFQKSEVLAALFYCQDNNSLAADVFNALTRVPKVFLFGMFQLHT